MQHKYPELDRNKVTTAAIYRAERDIADYNYRNLQKGIALENSGIVTMAITQMIATVSANNVVLNIRNMFDRLRTTRIIPEIHAYVERDGKRYLLRKRHLRNGSDIQFPPGSLMRTGITIAISLKKSDQETFHAKKSISTTENEQSRYLFLNIWHNGRYHIKTVWNEEDELGFDDILRVMKKFTDPIIEGINNLGRYVFISGTELVPITQKNVNYQSLNICVFWKRVMLGSAFRLVRGFWESYMRARITGSRNVQQFDKYEFLFRKGMHQFDAGSIERIVSASNNIVLNNHYAYLSNNSIKQKWDQNYDGRIVRMSHRTTDVRFEVSDIRKHEFDIFHTYIVMFIHKALTDEKIRAAFNTSRNYQDVKKLRKLREQDPELFNLKKYGSKKVYSIICQNQRQPLIYTPDEIKAMPAAEVKKLTQYWNFTLNKPAYYGCPNSKYPHLSFMVNIHPRHYCLPCCNKKPQVGESSKKTQINTICLQKHRYVHESKEESPSRHVMNYGKDIDIGRLSRIPDSSIKKLLFGTTTGDANYYLFGVGQHVPGAENIGIVYAIAEALDIPFEQLITWVVTTLSKKGTPLFNTLLNGSLQEYFQDLEHLISAIKELFVDMRAFSTEAQKFRAWPELFVEIFHILRGVCVFTFLDEDGSGNAVDLFVSDLLKNEMVYVNKLEAAGSALVTELADHVYVILFKRQNKCYPMFVLNADSYFKNLEVQSRSYKYSDPVIKLLYDMIRFETEELLDVDRPIDLSLMRDFTAKMPKYKITRKYVNKSNACYALLLDTPLGLAYTPIDYSVYLSDGVPIDYESYNRINYNVSHDSIIALIGAINAFIEENYRVNAGNLFTYRKIKTSHYVAIESHSSQSLTGGVIGVAADSMIYYFNKYHENELADIPINLIKYDYTELNSLIMARTPPLPDNRSTKLGEALYNNYIYQLFVIEFVHYLDRERNNEIRSRIIRLINETNFKKNVSPFRASLEEILADYPADFANLQNELMLFYYAHFNKALLLAQIDAASYEFDKVTLNRLRKLPAQEMRAELLKISKSFAIRMDFDTTAVAFPNIYMPCAEMRDNTGYCKGGLLMVNRNVEVLVDLLATDIMDSLKFKYLLSSAWMDTVTDYFQFTQWSSETVSVFRLTD